MMEWKEYRLGDVCKRFNAGKNIKASAINSNKGFPVFGGNGLRGYTEQSNFLGECAIIGRQGAYCGNVRYFSGEAYMTEHAIVVQTNDLADTYYLSKVLDSLKLGHLSSQSAQPGLSVQTLSKLKISLPPLSLQRRISSILTSLDRKIELNHSLCQKLEEMASTLFRAWFIDFLPFKNQELIDSPLGRIPKGWKVGTVEDLTQRMASGGTPKTTVKEYYCGENLWFSTKELKDEFLFDSEKHISDEAIEKSATKIFPRGSVLMAIYAAPTVGRLGILTKDSTCNQAAVAIYPKDIVGTPYIYLLLRSERSNLNNLANGAAQQNLNVKLVKTYKTIIPTEEVFCDFNKIVKPLFDRIENLQQETQNLTSLRDTLLPRLMSGELEL